MAATNNGGKLGLKDTISMATGFAIGSGVITLTGLAIGMTGRSVVFSYLLSAAMFLVAVIPYLIIASVYPVRSASYTYCSQLIHPRVGGFYIFVYLIGRLTIAMFSISFAQYLAALIPSLNQTVTAIAVLTLFYITNMFGLKSAAKLQNIMFYLLVFALLAFIVVCLPKINFNEYFTGEGYLVDGFNGIFSAASLLFFAVGGAGVLADFGSLIKKPAKVIPVVIVGVTLAITVVYALLSMVAAGSLPYEQVAFKPMTNSAAAVFGEGSIMYVLFLCGGALLALTTTLNSSFVWYTNATLGGCKDGWLPKSLTTTNKYGVPYKLTTIFYLFGLVPVLLNMDIALLGKIAVGLTCFMWVIPQFALINLPKRMPNRWKASRFAKMPQWSLWLLSILSVVLYGAQSISNFQSNPPVANVVIIVCIAASLVYVLVKKNPPKSDITPQMDVPVTDDEE
ncbi:MAG: APC family permease [Clostridia bacterium]|nr:APC family permease [Clostridia bacterium]